jgi:hypothetical protein
MVQMHSPRPLFSNNFHAISGFHFGGMDDLCTPGTIGKVKAQEFLANFRDADVYALGADSPGRKKKEWECVHAFWMNYFLEAQATLRTYSVMRSLELNLRSQH